VKYGATMMGFADILGHETAIKLLRAALRNNQLAHSYLFYGDDGIGKRLTAHALARAAACETAADDSCGTCASCRWEASSTHPDIREIRPSSKGRIIRIDSVRELQNVLVLKPMGSRIKAAIIDQADRLNHEAANAFLKTLEEPPDHSLIILITSRPSALPPTIVSRCLRVRFPPLSQDAIRRILMREKDIAQEDAARRAELSLGSLPRALNGSVEALEADMSKWITDVDPESLSDLNRLLDAAERYGPDVATAQAFLLRTTAWLRDSILASYGISDNLLHAAASPEVLRWSSSFRESSMHLIYYKTIRALQLLDRNVNPRLILEDLLFQFRDLRLMPSAQAGSGS
jgi:DNA polymerase III subunit delta'